MTVAEHLSLRVQFENLRAQWDNAVADGRVTGVEAGILIGKVGEAIGHLAETFVGTQEHFNAEVADGQRAFDEYIVPIDWPGIGPVLEAIAESGMRQLLFGGAVYARQMAITNNPELAKEHGGV